MTHREELEALKKQLQNEIKQTEREIELVKRQQKHIVYTSESSDSDVDLDVYNVREPSYIQSQCNKLETRLLATEELTGLTIRKYHITVMETPPQHVDVDLDSMPDGVWKLINSECRLNMITFNIQLYIHEPRVFNIPTTMYIQSVELLKSKPELSNTLSLVTSMETMFTLIRDFSRLYRERHERIKALADLLKQNIKLDDTVTGGVIIMDQHSNNLIWNIKYMSTPLTRYIHDLTYTGTSASEEQVTKMSTSLERLRHYDITENERIRNLSIIVNTYVAVVKSVEGGASQADGAAGKDADGKSDKKQNKKKKKKDDADCSRPDENRSPAKSTRSRKSHRSNTTAGNRTTRGNATAGADQTKSTVSTRSRIPVARRGRKKK